MSVYKRDSLAAKLLSYYTTEEQKVEFLKNRIRVFLIGHKGKSFTAFQIVEAMSFDYADSELVRKALLKLTEDHRSGVAKTFNGDKVVFPRESQRVV